jgi:hypothetical protein
MSFLLCGGCARHIKSSEALCPFCDATNNVPRMLAQPSPLVMSRSRVALLFGAAAISGTIVVAGCSSFDNSACCPPYGSPRPDPAQDSGPAQDSSNAEGGGVVAEAGAIDDASDAGDAGD